MEVVRMDEELVLKTSGCKRFGGSIPFASANGKVGEMDYTNTLLRCRPLKRSEGSNPSLTANMIDWPSG